MIEDFHVILGVRPGASAAEIRHAYLELAKEYHPDRNPNDPLAAEKFKQVHRAFEKLYKPWRWRFRGVAHTLESVFDEPESEPDEAASGPQRGWSRDPYPRHIVMALLCLFLLGLIGMVVIGIAERSAQEGRSGKKKGPPDQLMKELTMNLGDWTKKELTVDFGVGVKLEMVLIPAGEFLMGDDSEKPVHRVTITRPFYLGKYEVTQEQWQAVMGNNPSMFKGPKSSVERVSWDDCENFLNKLNAKWRPGGGKFQLPTEAQWEYACRAGSTAKFCFGDDEARLGDYAWYGANSGNKTRPVGQKKRNAWGLYDMHGNVWEWCADWYDDGYYAKSPANDPSGPSTGSRPMLRGGSWYLPAWFCRSAHRMNLGPGTRLSGLGLRVSLVPADN